MIRQIDRSAQTVAEILAAARALFADKGFDATSIDDIAAEAGVAKGAVYHHFTSKEDIFTRVLDGVQAEIAALPVPSAHLAMRDPLDFIAAETLRYLLAAVEPGRKRILLTDGPTVIGWRKWREIDDRYFAAGTRAVIGLVLGEKASPKEIEPPARLFMGAVMEACLACAEAPDPRKAAKGFVAVFRKMLEGLRADPANDPMKTAHRK